MPWLYQNVFAPWATDPRLASLAFAVVNLLAYAALAGWLDRRGVYIRV